jgi:hypothetical protein
MEHGLCVVGFVISFYKYNLRALLCSLRTATCAVHEVGQVVDHSCVCMFNFMN